MSLEVNNTGNNSPIIIGKDAMKQIRSKNKYELTQEQLINKLDNEQLFRKRLMRIKVAPAIASAVIVLLSVSAIIYYNWRNVTPEELFSYYYDAFEKSNDNGLTAFTMGDYKSAVKNLEDEYVIDGKYLRAIALIEREEFKQALSVLKKIDTQEAEWLRALCLMRTENHNAAIFLFDSIYRKGGLFSPQALEILNNHYYTYNRKAKKKQAIEF